MAHPSSLCRAAWIHSTRQGCSWYFLVTVSGFVDGIWWLPKQRLNLLRPSLRTLFIFIIHMFYFSNVTVVMNVLAEGVPPSPSLPATARSTELG